MLGDNKRIALPLDDRLGAGGQLVDREVAGVVIGFEALDDADNNERKQRREHDPYEAAPQSCRSKNRHLKPPVLVQLKLDMFRDTLFSPRVFAWLSGRFIIGGCLSSSGPLISAASATRPRASLLLTVPMAHPVISAASS